MKELKDLGLSDVHVKAIEDMGATSVADLSHLTVEDLTGIGVPVLKARRIVAEFAPKPAASLPTSIKLEQIKTVWQMSAAELFDIFADERAYEDVRDSTAEEWDSKARNRPAVVLVDGKPAKYLSLPCLDHVRRHGPVQYWGERDYPVVTARQSLAQKVLRDPLTGEVLVDGFNQTTLTNWKSVSVERLVLVAWAQGQNLLRNINPRDVATGLKAQELDEFWARVQTRFTAACQHSPGLNERIMHDITTAPDERLHPGTFVIGVLDDLPSGPTTARSDASSQDVMSSGYQKALRRVLAAHCVVQFVLIIRDAGLRSERINLQGGPEIAAKEIVDEASHQGQAGMNRLIAEVMSRCPVYFPLQY